MTSRPVIAAGRRRACFSWRPAQGDASPVEIFHVEMGDPGAPVLLLIHDWPTSSIDWFEVADQLSGRFRVCALDFPGYGFSDKPQGWGYSLARDEELIEFYLSEIIGAEAAMVVAHRAHPDGSAGGSGLCQPRNRPHPGVGLCHRPVAVAVGQRSRELAAGGDVELGEDLSEVVLDGVRTEEQPGGDLRVGQA
jgi:alpha/beta hydrolase fold